MRLKSQRKKQTSSAPFAHHKLFTFITCLSMIAVTLCAVSVMYWYGEQTIRDNEAAISSTNARMDQKIAHIKKQKRLDAARQLEASARSQQTTALVQIRRSPLYETTSRSDQCATRNSDRLTVVINKKHCLSPVDYSPHDLVSVGDFRLRKTAAEQFNAMLTHANTAGEPFIIASAYRSHDDQRVLYESQTTPSADETVARAGHSEHQTGLAVDLKTTSCARECFATTTAYTWLRKHAVEYGFIERYPANLTAITGYAPEAWHWRYVGHDAALDMRNERIETLEAYFGVEGGDYFSTQ